MGVLCKYTRDMKKRGFMSLVARTARRGARSVKAQTGGPAAAPAEAGAPDVEAGRPSISSLAKSAQLPSASPGGPDEINH